MKRYVGLLLVFAFVGIFLGRGEAQEVIRIGTSMGLTGPYSGVAREMVLGYNLAFKEINESGGIHGKRIVQVIYDDGYNPQNTVKNLTRLINKDKVPMLFAIFGTPPNAIVTLRLEVLKIPHFFPVSGASFLYKSPYVFTFQASYMAESRGMIKRAVKDGYRNIAVVYLANPYGWDCKVASAREAKGLGVRLIPFSVKRAGDLPRVVDGLVKKKVDALYLAIPNSFLVPLLKGLVQAKYFPALYAEYYSRLADALKTLGDNGASNFPVAVTGRFLPKLDEDYPAVRWYKAALARFMPDKEPTPASFQGYIMARTLGEILKRVPSYDPQGILKGAESIKNLDVGLPEKLSFSSRDHVGLTRVFLYRVEKGRLVPLGK